MIDRQTVLTALRCPDAGLLKIALSYANLSVKESTCIRATIIDDLTEEEAAEDLGYSRDYVAKHKAKAIERLQKAWEFCPLIPVMLQY